jgi:ADP-heptose:LPS heptosyltransferase
VKSRSKVALDRVVGVPSAWALSLAARSISGIARRSHSSAPETVQNIVVAKLLGLGSIIQATPLLRALKQRYPGARLHFLTGEANRGIVQRLSSIDQGIYLADRSVATLAKDATVALATLAREGIDLYFDLEVYSATSSCLSLLSLARNRFGLYRHSSRFKQGLFTHLLFFNVTMPIAEIYLQMVRMAGATETLSTELERIAVGPSDHESLRAKLAAAGSPLPARYVVVNPNASDLLLERRWPIDHFVRFLEMLVVAGERPVLIGSPGERPLCETIHGKLTPAAQAATVNSAGRFGLGELAALIEGASCVVTNDTGPMHMSFSLGRPTVCLFGPGSPAHYGIDRPNVQILYKDIFCSPCIYETDEPPCRGNNVCMQWISPEEVLESTLGLLRGEPRRDWRGHRSDATRDRLGYPLGMRT